jgi:bacillaene synthase trans-acting acyltransferase
MKKMIWMFAGQGAQYYQMGRELYERETIFREFMDRGDQLAQEFINVSLVELIYRPRADRFEPFRRLLHSHPAILLFECAIADLLKRRGLRPDYLLGYSLGEYACLVVSDAISFEDALVAVIKQAELLEYLAPPGAMLAILDSAELTERYPEDFGGCSVAAYNFSKNFVVSASKNVIQRLQGFLHQKGISSVELPLDYPFHSHQIEVVQTALESIASQYPVASPQIPVISAAKCGFLGTPSTNHLWDVIRNPVNFAHTIDHLETSGPYLYVDLGPSGSMATAIKYNVTKQSRSEFLTIASPFGHESKNLECFLEKAQ